MQLLQPENPITAPRFGFGGGVLPFLVAASTRFGIRLLIVSLIVLACLDGCDQIAFL